MSMSVAMSDIRETSRQIRLPKAKRKTNYAFFERTSHHQLDPLRLLALTASRSLAYLQ